MKLVPVAILQRSVHRVVPRRVINSIKRYLRNHLKARLWGPGNVEFKLYLFLYYLVHGKGQITLERETNFLKSDCHEVFGFLQRILAQWAETKLNSETFLNRKAIAKEVILDKQLNHVTGIIDSKDFKIQKQDSEGTKSIHHSYKEKHHAVRVQFIVLPNEKVAFIAGPYVYFFFQTCSP